jgi:hypothetical protein
MGIRQVAQHFGVSTETVRTRVRQGDIPEPVVKKQVRAGPATHFWDREEIEGITLPDRKVRANWSDQAVEYVAYRIELRRQLAELTAAGFGKTGRADDVRDAIDCCEREIKGLHQLLGVTA